MVTLNQGFTVNCKYAENKVILKNKIYSTVFKSGHISK